ncbi:MAG: DUF2225 domain-containing protein [Candidatus Obscuribacterales bacterium]|nr:DUF2225 domain-containing protein [Candidatus Obscuribacterales bacterium]
MLDFSLKIAKLECPACSHSFTSAVPAFVSQVTSESSIETDLHRIYSSSAFRGSTVGMCTKCGYASWLRAFKVSADEQNVEAEKSTTEADLRKYARAYVYGKQHKLNHLELGLIALNASWCARDAKVADAGWMSIAREELERALRHPSNRKDRGFYQFLLGELCRQESDFKKALQHFDLSVAGQRLPESLITRQKVQARSADSARTLLPPYLVENLFCPVKTFNAA